VLWVALWYYSHCN